MKIIEVTWSDSHRYAYQMAPDEEMLVVTITSVGYLVKEDKTSLTLAQDDIGGDVRGVIVIPKVNVQKRKVLR